MIGPTNRKETTMKTYLLSLGLVLATSGAMAQMPSGSQPGNKHKCIMACADTWTKFGLTAEQMAQVKDLQASCEKEHAAKPTDDAGVAKHEEKLRGILTPEQFTEWSQWCGEQTASRTSAPEMKE